MIIRQALWFVDEVKSTFSYDGLLKCEGVELLPTSNSDRPHTLCTIFHVSSKPFDGVRQLRDFKEAINLGIEAIVQGPPMQAIVQICP